jgi:hypothetical protein
MAEYVQIPGTLNLAFRKGDDFSVTVDFSIALDGYTVEALMHSVVGGQLVQAFTTTITNSATGIVSVSLTDTQTAALASGTYRWIMTGTASGVTRTYLAGYVEVTQ